MGYVQSFLVAISIGAVSLAVIAFNLTQITIILTQVRREELAKNRGRTKI